MDRRLILYAGAFEFPDRNAAAQRALSNALILKSLGYQVVLIGLSRDRPAQLGVGRAEHADIPFDCWEAPYPAGSLDWLKRIVSIADVATVARAYPADALAAVIAYDFPAVAQARLLRFCRARGARAIAEITEWYSVSRLVSPAAVMRNLDRPLRMRVVNPRMDGLIVASTYLRDFYARHDLPCVVLPTLMSAPVPPPGAPTPDGAPKRLFFAASGWDPAVVRETREGPKDRLDKVLEALVEARRRKADFRLDVYGVDAPTYLQIMPDHHALLAELGDRVAFHGRQPRDIVRARLAEADFSIFLRKSSIVSLAGFPTKFAESIQYGTPVITNAVGDVVLHHEEGRTGHVIDYDDMALAGSQLATILGQSAVDVATQKDFCHQSGLFAFQRYAPRIGDFMALVTTGVTGASSRSVTREPATSASS